MTESQPTPQTKPLTRPATQGPSVINPYGYSDETLDYLEGYRPFIYGKNGEFLGGDVPQGILEKNWSKLNHHLSLANLGESERKIQFHRSHMVDIMTISAMPKKNFTTNFLKTMCEVNRMEDLLITKSLREGGERDRTLLQMILSRTEQKSLWSEQSAQGQNKAYAWYDPRRLISKVF